MNCDVRLRESPVGKGHTFILINYHWVPLNELGYEERPHATNRFLSHPFTLCERELSMFIRNHTWLLMELSKMCDECSERHKGTVLVFIALTSFGTHTKLCELVESKLTEIRTT